MIYDEAQTLLLGSTSFDVTNASISFVGGEYSSSGLQTMFLSPIMVIIPILVTITVAFIGFRKAWAWLHFKLRGC